MPVTLAQWNAHKHRQRNSLWPSSGVFWNDIAIVAIACAGAFNVNLVGEFPGNEVLICILSPFLLMNHRRRAFRREYRWFYILLGCWLVGTIAGDLYLGVSVANKLKGIARVVFFGLDFATLAILIDRKTREVIVFSFGIVFIFASSAIQYRGDFFTVWKYGGGVALSIVALLISSYFFGKRRYAICVLISLGLAALNLRYAFRSQFAVHLVVAAIVLPIVAVRKHETSRSFDDKDFFKLVVVLALLGGSIYGANQAVKYAVSQNFFDEGTQAKFEAQSAGKLGVLVGGRPETLVAIQAIRDSPIIGHGSFAQDQRYVQVMQDIQYEYDYTDSDDPDESLGLSIPTHSHLTQAWVESGILGGIFWIYILAAVSRSFLVLALNRPTMLALYSYFLISFLWDICFSPMGSVNRMIGVFYILISFDQCGSAAKSVIVSHWRGDRSICATAPVRRLRGRHWL